MVSFIVLFLPAILCVWIYEALSKASLGWKSWIYRFSLNTVLINWICFAVKKWILGTATSPMSSMAADTTPEVAFKYLVMAIPLAVVWGVVQALLKKHVHIKTEDNNGN